MQWLITSEKSHAVSGFLSVGICVAKTHAAVYLIQQSRTQESEVSRGDVRSLSQTEVPQQLCDVQTLNGGKERISAFTKACDLLLF